MNYTCLINDNLKALLTIYLIDIIPTNNWEIVDSSWPFPLLAKYLKHYCSATIFFFLSSFCLSLFSLSRMGRVYEQTNDDNESEYICRERETHTLRFDEKFKLKWNSRTFFFCFCYKMSTLQINNSTIHTIFNRNLT